MYLIEWYQAVDRKAWQQFIRTLGEKNSSYIRKEVAEMFSRKIVMQ